MHRSHYALGTPGIAVESTTGEIHLRHHISPTGFYRGRKVRQTKADS
jgi:large subunit ribosomal protein L32